MNSHPFRHKVRPLVRNSFYSTTSQMKTFLLLTFFIYFSDSLISYTAPIIIEARVANSFITGLIFSLSSVAGLVADILIPRFFSNATSARYFKYFIFFSLATLLSLFIGTHYILFLVFGMIFWGVNFDFLRFFNFKIIKQIASGETYSEYWGYHETMRTITVLTAPAIALLVSKTRYEFVYIISLASLAIGYLLFISLTQKSHTENAPSHHYSRLNMKMLKLLVKPILPLYAFTISLIILDASFWTIGILLSQELGETFFLGNFLIIAYTFPGVFAAPFSGYLATRFGKKRTAFTSAIIGSMVLTIGLLFTSPIYLILVVFVSSLFYSLCWPQIFSAFEDYIVRVGRHSDDMISIQDSATNIGYIVGPILAGLLATLYGYSRAFTILALLPLLVAIIGLLVMKHKVHFSRSIP